ncbi:MAG: tRNA pseudouridine(38-40) synthase TruA [Janthinobacterium lividum]
MEGKQRYFAELAFDGTKYHGWQIQQNALSVQEVFNKALAVLLRQPVETVGCGRTDTGVHARQLFVHFDSENEGNQQSDINNQLKTSLNAILPKDMAVKNIISVAADAHARFDATLRAYEYHIHFDKNPFKQNYSWQLRDFPDLSLMNEAANIIKEYQDFSCFSKSNTQVKTNFCAIKEAYWQQKEDGSLVFYIAADRFLRNMVRAIVGTLISVGKKEIEPEAVRKIIESKDRSNAGVSVPACGLYLTKVKYPYITST